MFSGCSSLKFLNISNFSTINVLYMSNLFNGNSALKSLNISNFNTQNVVNMDDMFQGCTSLLPRNIITNAPVIRKVNYYGY
jgi:surface protein